MRLVRLASETDFDGWRHFARALRIEGCAPGSVIWTVDGAGDLFAEGAPAAADAPAFSAPREFVELAANAILNRSDERFAVMYRVLFRLQAEPNLMRIVTDPDVARLKSLAHAVDKAAHKMKAFVRFRLVSDPDQPETYAAWFEPAHRVAEKVAPFFARRFSNMRFSILTPDVCVHWDGERLGFSPGADPADAPAQDSLEDYWRTYYASIFNPARLRVAAMEKEMPRRYWRNLPEARLIPELIEAAESRAAAMVASPPTEPARRIVRQAARVSRDATFEDTVPSTLEAVWGGVQVCRRCELWRDATQGVAGEGPKSARLMFVGEQPGDQEDLAGKPFVGPAGQVLNRALAEAGVPRGETYVTNAVKHFRHELRGKRRLHKNPDSSHVEACRWWLDAERAIVRPRVIVALGGTAALSLFGKPMAIGKFRQEAWQLPDQAQGVVTYHPSYLLRVPDAEAKAKAFAMFVDDLKFAWKLAA